MVNNNAPVLRSARDGMVYYGSGIQGQLSAVNVQADGKIVVLGTTVAFGGSKMLLMRYNSDGSMDNGFGSSGVFLQSTSGGTPADFVVQPDGKIAVALTYESGHSSITAMRFNANGTLDGTFGSLGTAYPGNIGAPGGSDASRDRAAAIALEGDKLILVGSANWGTPQPDNDFGIIRIKADGQLDTGFYSSGTRALDFNTNAEGNADNDSASSVVVQADGKIIVAGTSLIGADKDFAIARFNTDGSIDTSFDGDGLRSYNFGYHANDAAVSVLLQSDGKIVVVGSTTPASAGVDFGLIRLESDGSVDSTFGTGGRVVTGIGPGSDVPTKAVLQADGKILVVGGYYPDTTTSNVDTVVVRYNRDGTLDSSFGSGGKAIFAFGLKADYGLDIAVQANGKIVITGAAQDDTSGLAIVNLFTARLNTNGSLDATFGAAHFVEGGAAVAVDEGLYLFDQEGASSSYNGASMLLTRAGGQNATDVFRIKGALSVIDQGGPLIVDGATIGTVVANSGGKLLMTFNSSATATLVERALHQITYTNISQAPPSSVTLRWTFSDGNGTDTGPLGATADTVIHITAVNDAPRITSNGGGAAAAVSIAENGTLVTTVGATDPDSVVHYSLGGTDAGKFHLVGNQLRFVTAADFDTRSDANHDGIYNVTVIASDGKLTDTQVLSVSLIDVPGNSVKGTSKGEKIDLGHAIKGKGATAENDRIDGKAGNDTIKGGGDNDTIIGGAGKDSLKGDAGHDTFVFKDALVAANVDHIKDFTHGTDFIGLGHKQFKAIGAALDTGEFYAHKNATAAHDKDDRIIYDKKSGALYYDDDGKGGHAAIQFAILDKHPGLDFHDFSIV